MQLVMAGYMATKEEMEDRKRHMPLMVTVDVWVPLLFFLGYKSLSDHRRRLPSICCPSVTLQLLLVASQVPKLYAQIMSWLLDGLSFSFHLLPHTVQTLPCPWVFG